MCYKKEKNGCDWLIYKYFMSSGNSNRGWEDKISSHWNTLCFSLDWYNKLELKHASSPGSYS